MLGKGYSKPEVFRRMQQTAEGLTSVQPVLEIAERLGIDMPIVTQVSDVLEGRMSAKDFGKQLNLADAIEMEF